MHKPTYAGHIPPRPMPDHGPIAPAMPGVAKSTGQPAQHPSVAGAPSSFQPATWRGTLPPDEHTGNQGICFNLSDGTVLRLCLSRCDVRNVLETLAPGYWSRSAQGNHSAASSLMSSDPKSVPSDGVNVCPPAASSTACTKEP